MIAKAKYGLEIAVKRSNGPQIFQGQQRQEE